MLSRVGAAEAALYHDEPGAPDERSFLDKLISVARAALPKGAVILGVLSLMGAVADLFATRVLLHTFGDGPELDAYNTAFKFPELALQFLVMGGVIGPFLPIFVGLRDEAKETAREFARTIMTLAASAMAVAAVLLFIFAPQILQFQAPNFAADARGGWYIDMLRILCVAQLIGSVSMVLGEVLIAEKRWITYGLYDLLYQAGICFGAVVMVPVIGVYGAAIGAVLGSVLALGVRVFGVVRTGFELRPSLSLRVKGLGEFVRLMLPKMVSQPLPYLLGIFFFNFASTLAAGSATVMATAQRFQSLPETLIGVSFATAAFPALSAAANAGDKRAFKKQFSTTFATIAFFSTCAAIALIILGRFVISTVYKGGNFDDTDVNQTTMVVMILAISIPLESLTELLVRSIFATRNTYLPMAATMAGFIAGVISAFELGPYIGLAAIPIGYVFYVGVKLVVLTAVLQPRMSRIGGTSRWARAIVNDRWGNLTPQRRPLSTARIMVTFMGIAALSTGMVFAGSQAINRAADAQTTPWAPRESIRIAVVPTIAPTPTAAPRLSSGDPTPGVPAASPTPNGPFTMDMFQQGDFVGELKDVWCVPAAMQTSINIMSVEADTTRDTQAQLFDLAVSIAGSSYGGADPAGWAAGLQSLGYGKYKVSNAANMNDAVHNVAKAIRKTARPAGLLVWRGWHSWVVSGFTATADPAVTDNFTVLSLRIEDVWYPRVSSLWSRSRNGMSRPPDSDVPVKALTEDYLAWSQGKAYPDRDHKWVYVEPLP